jgi:hypothetical protein
MLEARLALVNRQEAAPALLYDASRKTTQLGEPTPTT